MASLSAEAADTDVYVPINSGPTDNHICNSNETAIPKAASLSARTLNRDECHWIPSDNPSSAIAKKKLLQASVICAAFLVIEIIAGIAANSLALITDASHLLSDLSSFLISLFALWVSGLPGTIQLSFGYHRAEILGALISVMLIWVLTLFLVAEAIHRFTSPQPVDGFIMFITALFGTIANLIMTYILGVHSHGIGGSSHSHNHDDHDEKSHNHNHNHFHNNKHSHNHKHTHPHNGYTPLILQQYPPPIKDTEHSNRSQLEYRDLKEMIKSNATEDESRGAKYACDDHQAAGFPFNGLRQGSFASDLAEPLVVVDDYGKKNVNLRAAYIHALGDLVQNIGVLVASMLIWYRPDWSIADPICTFLFSILVLTTTISILKEATNVLMEGTPSEVDLAGLRTALAQIGHVSEVHDLHVWSLSVGKPSLACHIVVDFEEEARRVLREATYICQQEFGILHTTIQIDFSANKLACGTDAHSKCH